MNKNNLSVEETATMAGEAFFNYNGVHNDISSVKILAHHLRSNIFNSDELVTAIQNFVNRFLDKNPESIPLDIVFKSGNFNTDMIQGKLMKILETIPSNNISIHYVDPSTEIISNLEFTTRKSRIVELVRPKLFGIPIGGKVQQVREKIEQVTNKTTPQVMKIGDVKSGMSAGLTNWVWKNEGDFCDYDTSFIGERGIDSNQEIPGYFGTINFGDTNGPREMEHLMGLMKKHGTEVKI